MVSSPPPPLPPCWDPADKILPLPTTRFYREFEMGSMGDRRSVEAAINPERLPSVNRPSPILHRPSTAVMEAAETRRMAATVRSGQTVGMAAHAGASTPPIGPPPGFSLVPLHVGLHQHHVAGYAAGGARPPRPPPTLAGASSPLSSTETGPAERAWLPPRVVLVINGNPYGLMVALSYICRFVYMH